jgi:hypothetical protein
MGRSKIKSKVEVKVKVEARWLLEEFTAVIVFTVFWIFFITEVILFKKGKYNM